LPAKIGENCLPASLREIALPFLITGAGANIMDRTVDEETVANNVCPPMI
jgi:lipoprotein signal peptidase